MVLEQKSDALGAISSTLCLIHCLCTPLLFVVHSSCCEATTPLWWKSIDYLFLIISFFAVYKSATQTAKNWMKYALAMSWLFLAFIIVNERFQFISLFKGAIYVASAIMVGLHIYNSKYCQCSNDKCCSSTVKTN